MGKVLIELEKLNSTTELTKACITTLFSGHDIEPRFKLLKEITCADIKWCDTYFAIRPDTPMSVDFAKSAKQAKKFYVTLFDDDLLNIPGALQWRIKCTRECIEMSDVVVSTNPTLAGEYGAISGSKRYVVLNTPVDESEYMPTHNIQSIIRFVYAAGRDHELFFEHQIKPILKEFLDIYSTRVHFTFIGVKPDLKDVGYRECFTYEELMSLSEYNQYMRRNQFDVGVAPLDNNRFSNRKYFNKYIEYSKVGIMGIYSNCEPFTYIVMHKQNGLLVKNKPEAWLETMRYVVENKPFVEECAERAQKYLKEHFSTEKVASVFLNQIPEFENFKNDLCVILPVRKIQYQYFLIADKLKKLIFQLKTRGIKGVVKLISNYITDKKMKR